MVTTHICTTCFNIKRLPTECICVFRSMLTIHIKIGWNFKLVGSNNNHDSCVMYRKTTCEIYGLFLLFELFKISKKKCNLPFQYAFKYDNFYYK
jgi:hypothetical protein